ncbi:DUF11 domain-containing protein [Candidatus Woesearchaeota archaeon]|nr:DUF11 domain-containing protein [Candidatus Woesearchaeota archaeon]
MSQKRDWPRSLVVLLAVLLLIALGVEAWLLFGAQSSFVNFTGRQSAGVVSLTLESDIPAITITKTDSPDPVNTSGLLTYVILLNSTGTTRAYNITVNETYPAQVEFVSAEPTLAGNVTFTLSNLSNGDIYRINITVNVSSTVPNATLINNTANLTFFSTLNTKHGSLVTINTTVTNGSVAAEPSPAPGPSGEGTGGGGGGGGCISVCTPGTSICSPDGRKTCLVSGGCAYYALAPCAIGSTCSAGACLPCTESWICGDWSACSSEGVETRDCFDVVGCGTTKLLPAIERACIPAVLELPDLIAAAPSFTIPPGSFTPTLLRLLPVEISLAILLGLLITLVLLITYRDHLEKLVLYVRVGHLQSLIASKQYALAHEYADKVVKPYLDSLRMDPRKHFDRKLYRMYFVAHRDLTFAYAELARRAGDKAKELYWKKRAHEYAEEALKYH